jgi:type II secretory pathway pseudopilin PulG
MKFKVSKEKVRSFSTVGFTIIELLVAFSIMAIITGVGLTSFVSISRRQILYEAASNVKQKIDQARFNAISIVKPSTCSPTSELTSYKFHFCHSGNTQCSSPSNRYKVDAVCSGINRSFDSKLMPQSLTFGAPPSELGTPCGTISFSSVRAKVTGGSCVIRISGSNQHIDLTVDSQGYVSF